MWAINDMYIIIGMRACAMRICRSFRFYIAQVLRAFSCENDFKRAKTNAINANATRILGPKLLK